MDTASYIRPSVRKRISHSTSHAESLSQHGCLTHCELIAMRATELTWPSRPSLEDLIEADADACYDIPIDTMTDCRD
eukprot:854596-Pyramimonas_sp.AAC.1